MEQPDVSVILCTHNPRADYLDRVLVGLRRQTLSFQHWELLLIDNASKESVADRFDIGWHPNGRHVREDELGLTEARNLLTNATAPVTPTPPRPPWRRVLSATRSPSRWQESVVRALLGKHYQDLLLGRFRNAGEIHQWMYDSYSLARLLSAAGFADFRQYAATESRFPGWVDYHLDTEPDGRVYKPDSLFVESIKP